MAEFISTDVKKTKRTKQLNKVSSFFQVTPLLVFEIIILMGIVWFVSFVAVTLPYRNTPLIKERSIYEKSSIQQQYISAIPFYPIKLRLPNAAGAGAQQQADPNASSSQAAPSQDSSETVLAPVIQGSSAFHSPLESFFIYMGIYLCGGHALVPQYHLKIPNVNVSVFIHKCCGRMP